MGNRMIGAVGAGLAAMMVLGACGGDDEALSKTEYIAKGDALCKSLDAQVDPAFDKMFAEFPEVDMAVAKKEMPKVAAATKKFAADFTALEGPEADAKTIDQLNTGVQKFPTVLGAAARHAEAGDEEEFKSTLFENFEEFDKVDEQARDYGFKVCGAEDEDEGEEGEEGGPATPLSPEQQAFVSQADEICKASDEIIEPKLGPVFSAKLPEATTAIRDIILPAQRDQIAKLRALTPPKGDEAKVKGLVDSLEAVNPGIERLLAAAEAGDKKAYNEALRQVGEGFEATEEPFESYGFEECGG